MDLLSGYSPVAVRRSGAGSYGTVGLKYLDNQIDMGETLNEILHMAGGRSNLYEADRECFFGVLGKFHRRGGRYLELEWNILLNPDGEVLYCLPETMEAVKRNDYRIGPGDYHYLKLPYPSGTVVESIASPFFPAIKGVMVNRIEPWEEGFAQDDEQWLAYPDRLHESRDAGIGVIPLDNYASLTFGADFVLPFVQFFKRCEGLLSENEKWLYELGELVRKDKSCFALILRDRQPGKCLARETDRPRAYVRKLEERLRRGETEMLAREKQQMRNRREDGQQGRKMKNRAGK